MAGIFISYRRADSDGWAGRLRDALRVRFGELVFQDVDNIPDGEIFSDVIDRALRECDVALIIIGPNWASARDENGGRRLDHEDDWVRTETAMVLNRSIRVVPVLVGGARMPRPQDLPEELRSLTKRQAREIRSTSWDADVALLAEQLKQIVEPRRKALGRYAVPALALIIVAGVAASGVYLWRPTSSTQQASAPASTGPHARDDRATDGATPREASTVEHAAPLNQRAPAASPQPERPSTSSKSAPPTPPEPERSAASSKPAPAASLERERAGGAAAPLAVAKEPARAKPEQEMPSAPIALAKPAETSKPPRAAARAEIAPKTDRIAAAPRSVRPAPDDSPSPTIEPRDAPAVPSRVTPAPSEAARAPAPAQETGAEKPAASPPVTAKAVTRTITISLPNRPASARELKVGDSWTYRLKEARFDRDLATVTHEIGGGDQAGIRETVRLVTKKPATDVDIEAGGLTRTAQRRLPLEPRIFEQQLSQGATLFEFAPFMGAFSELQPGVRWSKIAGATSSDSINDWRFSGRVTGRERVRVPAGTFEAIKAELEGQLDISFPSTRDPFSETAASYQTYSIWFVPELGRAVKYERRTFNRGRRLLEHEQYELLSYQLK